MYDCRTAKEVRRDSLTLPRSCHGMGGTRALQAAAATPEQAPARCASYTLAASLVVLDPFTDDDVGFLVESGPRR